MNTRRSIGFVGRMVVTSLLVAFVAPADARTDSPALPYVSVGACPGEACYYNVEFIATQDTVARRGHRREDGVAYPVRKGQRLFGTNGVIVTHKLGIQRAIRDCTVGDLVLKRGDIIYDLHYVALGHYKAFYKGHVVTYDHNAATDCLKEEQKLDSRWWIQAEDEQGRKGWVEGQLFIHQGKYSTDEELQATWISLRPGEEKLRIRYTGDGQIYYKGKPAGRLVTVGSNWTPVRVLVSTVPPFLALGCIELRGKEEYCPDLYHILPHSQMAVPVCSPGSSRGGKCQKHKDRDLWILHHEHLGLTWGDGRLYRINYRTGEAARIPINLAEFAGQQFIDMHSFEWSADGRGFTVYAYVRCEGMGDQRCDGRLGRPRRVTVELDTLAVQVGDPL